MRNIRLNFLPFETQDFGLIVYRRVCDNENFDTSKFKYYDLDDNRGVLKKFEISFEPIDGYVQYQLPSHFQSGLVAKDICKKIAIASQNLKVRFDENIKRPQFIYNIEVHEKGSKSIWLRPYFLKSQKIWGILLDYKFEVSQAFKLNSNSVVDKDILIASGSLNTKGYTNFDFYIYKHNYIQQFIKETLPLINNKLDIKIKSNLLELPSYNLLPKTYVFGSNEKYNSSYLGLKKFGPLEQITADTNFIFLYKKVDREIAVSLLRGLRGESSPNTFEGMSFMFKMPFTNNKIKGIPVDELTDEVFDQTIQEIKASTTNTIPIVLTNSKKSTSDDELYYRLKHKFTEAGIPCQVVTRDLVKSEMSLKYSLSNIGLQIFCKAGGKPWKMKPDENDYLIIGVGQAYHIENDSLGNHIDKVLSYSILTDSTGLFKDLQILSEGEVNSDNYHKKMVAEIVKIINEVDKKKYKRVIIHSAARLSVEKILSQVAKNISQDIELVTLVINSKSDLFGFDYFNNGLVPFESSFVKISNREFLVWFEGIESLKPKITKRYGNPLLINFWYANKEELFKDSSYKEKLLQDCINLSGANWRGFKAKQLPISIFYCQRVADFINKFHEYKLDEININNLKPWFL